MCNSIPTKTHVWKAVALAAGVALAMLCFPVHAAPASGGDTVQGLYDALLGTMKNGRTLGQSGRFTQLEPVIRRTFDIPSMTRLSVGASWAGLSEAQQQQVTDSFCRYISAIYADRFDSYAGQKLQVTGEQPNAAGIMVKSQIVKANGEPVKVPVDQMIEEGLHEIRPAVLVIEVISVLPHVAGQERCLSLRQRIDRVRRRHDLDLPAIGDEPSPATAELADSRRLELLLEFIETAAATVDRLGNLSARRAAAVRLHAVPEESVIPHLSGVVEDPRLG